MAGGGGGLQGLCPGVRTSLGGWQGCRCIHILWDEVKLWVGGRGGAAKACPQGKDGGGWLAEVEVQGLCFSG